MRAITASAIVIVFAFLIIASFMASGGAAAQTDCGIQLLTSNAVQGSWTSDCTSQYRQDSYARSYSLRLTEPAEVTITLESEADPYLFLHTEQGDFIDENDDIDLDVRNYNSRIIASLSAGSYTIEATTYLERVTGDFTLTIEGIDLTASDDNDRAALTALYHATDGDEWYDNTNWLSDAPLDEWYGLTTDEDGGVTRLHLEQNNLEGEIPPELGNLANLQTLNLGNNDLSGELPGELGRLTNLTYLDFWGNELTGEIPPELGNLTYLATLYLLANELTGEIPAELGELTRLRVLHLGENQLTGSIPPQLGNLPSLGSLMLFENELTGEMPPELGNLSNLTELHLYENELTGQIPVTLGNLTDLTELHLRDNNLTGEIPPELGNLTRLRYIFLMNNNLTGQMPGELGNLSNLGSLGLASNNLTGEIPPELADVKTLRALWIRDNDLTAESFLPRLGELTNLTHLDIGGNQIRGADVLSHIAELPELWELGLHDSQLTTEELSPYLSVLSNIRRLKLSDNLLTGDQMLTLFAEFDNLDHLDFGNNQLTGEIPVEWASEDDIFYLDINSNLLTGPVHPELGDLEDLEYLGLSNNHLTGELPDSLMYLNDLETFHFHNNAGLCAPTDATFQAWLQSVINVQGPNCAAAEPPTPEPTPTPSPTPVPTPTPMPGNPIPEGCTLQSIVGSDSTIDDAWTSECVSQNRVENGEHYAKFFGFTVDRTSSIDITLVSRTDTYMFLLDEYGRVVEEDDDDDEDVFDLRSRSSGIRITLDPGNYIVEATTYANEVTDDFTLTIANPDITALRALYHATNGANWTNNDNWLTDAPLSEWYGVTTNDEGSVTVIYLIGNNLVGTIPAELGGMHNLEGLYLARNQLSGAIPPVLGNLRNLETLMLFRNELSGAIPPELGSLANLEELHLGRNQLSGHIPITLGNLQSLTRLHLTVNELSGVIPASLGNLTELRQLSIASNNLSGPIPSDIADLPNLTHIYLWGNNLLAGRFVNSLDRMTELRFLDIGGNNIDGEDVFAELSALHNLTGLGLHDSNITDDHLSAYMDDLQALDLEFLNLSGNNLADLQTLVDLSEIETIQRLAIHGNDLSGELPRTMTRLTLMRLFYFHANPGLCAPADDEFQDWLRGIRDVLGDTCAGSSPTDAPAQQSSGDEFDAMMSTSGEAEDNNSLLSH